MIPVPELELEDADGNIYPLQFPGRHVMEASGLGMPPIRHWTTRSPYQHGRTHWGYAFQPRVINLVLYNRGNDRSCMYRQRQANCAMLNPMNGPHKLRLTWPDGQTFEVHDGWYNNDYGLSSAEGGWDWQIGGLQLIFNDPIWKWTSPDLGAGETLGADGQICMETSTFTIANHLVLPFDGPFLLGTATGTATLACNNAGSWAVKPTITVEGPVGDWTLTNLTTGKQITWDGYAIAAAEVVTLDVAAGTAVNDAGTDLNYVGGNFGTFELEPGTNNLEFYGLGGVVDGTTTLSVCWYVEVLGT